MNIKINRSRMNTIDFNRNVSSDRGLNLVKFIAVRLVTVVVGQVESLSSSLLRFV